MGAGGDHVGRWGLALIVATGAVGAGLAVHGWSTRGAAVVPSLAGGRAGISASATPAAHRAGPSAPVSPSQPATAGASTAQPSPTATGSPASGSPAAGRPGPLLKTEPFANAAFQIWPGPLTGAAKQALTGLVVTVHKRAGGLAVTASVAGQGNGSTHVYVGGARVYVVEASLGDDSGNADYSLGDDGLVVTDSQGRIVQ